MVCIKKVVKNHMIWDHFCHLIEKKTFFKKNPLELFNQHMVCWRVMLLSGILLYLWLTTGLINYLCQVPLGKCFFHLNV